MSVPYRTIPRKVWASAALIALLGAGAATMSVTDIADFEGYVPEVYADPVGIPTKCFGDTTDLDPGRVYTFDECVRSLNDHAVELMKPVMKCVPSLSSQPDGVKAAVASMVYNIGNGAFCRSSVAAKFNAGDWEGGCRRIAEIYTTAKGKVLKGLVNRRNRESATCLSGLASGGGSGACSLASPSTR